VLCVIAAFSSSSSSARRRRTATSSRPTRITSSWTCSRWPSGLGAIKLATRHPSPGFTFGLRRAEPVAALVNGALVIEGLHALHVWSLGTGHDAITVHVIAKSADASLATKLGEKLRKKFAAEYVTVQVEVEPKAGETPCSSIGPTSSETSRSAVSATRSTAGVPRPHEAAAHPRAQR